MVNKSNCQSKPESIVTITRDNIIPCSPLKANCLFGGTCRLHLQVRRINQARNQRWSFRAGFLLCLYFVPENGGYMFLWNVGWLSTADWTLHNHRLTTWIPTSKISMAMSIFSLNLDLMCSKYKNELWYSFHSSALCYRGFHSIPGKFKGILFSPDNLRTDKLSGSLDTTSWPVLR
jgi:hypothetical protein